MPNRPDDDSHPARLRRLRQCRFDLGGEAAGEPGVLVDVVGVDQMRHESGDSDEEQQQRDEEQEQAEGDRAPGDRAADLAVTLVDPQPDVDERLVLVARNRSFSAAIVR